MTTADSPHSTDEEESFEYSDPEEFVVVLPDWLDIDALAAPTAEESVERSERELLRARVADDSEQKPERNESPVDSAEYRQTLNEWGVCEGEETFHEPFAEPAQPAQLQRVPQAPSVSPIPTATPRPSLPTLSAAEASQESRGVDGPGNPHFESIEVAIAETDVFGGDAVAVELERELTQGPQQEAESLESVSLTRLAKIIVCLTLAGLGVLLWQALPFYQLAIAERPFHPFYSALRPSGSFGLSFGIGGTLLMASSLLYLGRKYLVRFNWVGSLQTWLQFHIVTALVGAAFVLFHSNFVPTSAHGMLASAALVIIVLSGALGRYVVAHTPKTLRGRELELEAIQERLAIYRRKLIDLGVSPALLDAELTSASRRHRMWLVPGLLGVIFGDKRVRREYKKLRDSIQTAGVAEQEVMLLARRLCRERHWLVRYRELRQLIGAWRFVHRWLSIILLLSLVAHVGLALRFGSILKGAW